MARLLILQHDPLVGLGNFEEVLKEKGFEWDVMDYSRNDSIPTYENFIERYSGLIALGGPQSVNQTPKDPFLLAGSRLLVAVLEHKKPYLGICLGAQMLSYACGLEVKRAQKPHRGWHEIRLDDNFAARNPLFFQLTSPLRVFRWHGELCDVPTQGYRLASADDNPVEAFCFNGNAYGIQFHPEVTLEMVQDWLQRRSREFTAEEAAKILSDTAAYILDLQKISRRIITGFASLCRDSTKQQSGF